MSVVRNELRADLRITGENAVKAGLHGVGRAADDAGGELREMGHDADFLQRKLVELRATQLALVQKLNQTGDVSLIKDINKARREVRQFERLGRELAAEATDLGQQIGAEIGHGVKLAMPSLGPILIPALIGVGATLLPGLGAMVAGAVTGAVGAGGLVGGVVAAIHDPAVKHAAEDLGQAMKSSFAEIGTPFVGPVVEALGLVRDAGRQIAGDLKHDFDILAPALVPFTKGLLGLLTEMMPGLTQAFQNSLPVLRAMSAELPKIGKSIGDFFQIVSEDSDATTLGFIALSKTIQNALVFTAKFLDKLGSMYRGMVVGNEAITSGLLKTTSALAFTGLAGQYWIKTLNEQHDAAQELLDDLNKANHSAEEFTQGLFGMGNAADRAAADIADMKTAMDDAFGQTMGLDEANLAYKKSLIESHKTLADGKRTLDENTEAGQENVTAALDRLQVIKNLSDAEYNHGVTLDETNKRYLQRVDALKAELIQMGYNKKAVEDLIAKYEAIPNIITTQLEIKAGGEAAAWSLFRSQERQLSEHMGPLIIPNEPPHRAAGGPVSAGRMYRVNENGVEFFSPSTNGYVTPLAPGASSPSGASGGSRPVVNITYQPSGDALLDAFMAVLWPRIIKQARVDGGSLAAFGAA